MDGDRRFDTSRQISSISQMPVADAPRVSPPAYPATPLEDPTGPTTLLPASPTPTRLPPAEVATDQAAPEASKEPDPAKSDEPEQGEIPDAAVALLDEVNALHRDNLLGPRYRYAGVGMATGRYGPSWTLDLGSK